MIRDRAGNQGGVARSFNVDTQPALQIAAPPRGARLGSSVVDLEVRYSDDQPLDLASFAARQLADRAGPAES